jgi:DNA-binding transcriptional ArsR family regulator
LAKGEECVASLARPHAMSLAAVSKHLIVLEKAGLVKRRRDGRAHSLALEAKPMQEAREWLDGYRKFWEANLQQFEKYLDKLQEKESKHENK